MRALVITHGGIGLELVNVVQQIMGPVPGLTAMSNRGKSAQEITALIKDWLGGATDANPGEAVPDEAIPGEVVFGEPGKALVLIDDYGGSCATASQLACGPDPDVAIISGVNLAMLLGYVTWRETTEFKVLVRKLVEKGREAITIVGAR
jgi:mannose/fructose-specific phosphotransferase system component IIA